MYKQILWLAGLILLLTAASAAQAAVHEPYIADWNFGTKGVVTDPLVKFVPQDPFRASGERVTLDSDGNTIVAGIGHMWSMFSSEWVGYLVLVRYGPDGQRQVWSDDTPGYSDASHTYLYLAAGSPDYAPITAVADVTIGPYGDINVLVDALSTDGTTTDSRVVTFGEDGAYKGIVTHMATPGENDVGAAILPWGSDMFIVSSAGTTVTVGRYSLNYSDGAPALTTTWGSAGRATQTLMKCQSHMSQIHDSPCALRARRALIAETGTVNSVYVAGEYMNDQGSAAAQSDMFIMRFDTMDGANVAPFPTTWDSPDTEDGLRGLAFRSKGRAPKRSRNELYLLDAFPRACRSGFIVGQFNADTGAFADRTWTLGGGSNADPGTCANVISLEATDLILLQDYSKADRYVAVVGSRFTGEPYTGADAFVAWIDTQNMPANPQIQTFTHNASQEPDDAGFNAVTGNMADGSYTATGVSNRYDGDSSVALTIRMHPDRIFTNDFEPH